MGFPGTWMTESESVVYRVVPKCACSTIGQIMFYSDHGEFFDGDIHDAKSGMHKWALEDSQEPIARNVQSHGSYAFTCVRNPYTRILSSFFDKICGIQRNGKRYRGNLVPLLVQKYGIEVGGADRFQNQYMLLRYRSAPVLAAYFFVSLSGMATACQTPSGWYGLTLGPPIFWTSRPLAAKAVSRIISASMRKRGPRDRKRLSRSLTNFSGVAIAACR